MMFFLIAITPLILWMLLYLVKLWVQGPTKGSDAKVWLGEKVVVITGKLKDVSKISTVPFVVKYC